jgi:hypothetical protein
VNRRLANPATAASFLLLLATTALLLRSYWDYDQFMHISWNDSAKQYLSYEIFWYRGRILLTHADMTISAGSISDMWHARSPPVWKYVKNEAKTSPIYYDFKLWSIDSVRPRGARGRVVQIGFNGWPLAVVFAVFPLTWMIKRVRRPPGANVCPQCGYDLRATPNRCPECGTIPATTTLSD